MKIKSATLLGMIGAIISIAIYVFFFLLNIEAIKLVPEDMDYEQSQKIYMTVNVASNLCQSFSAFTLAIFFYVLHKNQNFPYTTLWECSTMLG